MGRCFFDYTLFQRVCGVFNKLFCLSPYHAGLLICFSVTQSAYARDRLVDWDRAQPLAEFASGVTREGKPYKSIIQSVYSPQLSSTVFFGSKPGQIGPITESSSHAFILFSGTGAKIAKGGLSSSMRPLFDYLSTRNQTVIGFENPLYDFHQYPHLRKEVFQRYGSTKGLTRWMASAIGQVRSLPEVQNKKIWIISRSTGAAVGLQVLQDHLNGESYALPIQDLGILAQGILDPRDGRRGKWIKAEKSYIIGSDLADLPLAALDDAIFRDMNFVEKPSWRNSGKGSRVITFLSANEEYYPPKDQLNLGLDYLRNHQALNTTLFALDTRHNVGGELSYTDISGKHVMANGMARLAPIINDILSGHFDQQKGSHLVDPGFYAQVKGTQACINLLGQFPFTSVRRSLSISKMR